ncbi:MAG TPA: glycosyltransferase [Gemmatimonadaceae bacterium]|nr:glycosyltransferase [Gemmatimonadaceae bacterium]
MSLTARILVGSAALPWLLWPLVAALRVRLADALDAVPPAPPPDAPLLSIVLPARNEERAIASCMRSVLSSTYPALELIVVDDHSTDRTAPIAREIAAADPRVRVLSAPPLPDGWFGKQWACAQGAAAARGSLLCFTDADTTHGAELHARAVNALRQRNADLLSVAGTQEMQSFWERVAQPQVFAMLLLRFGGTEGVNCSHRVTDKVANGQFLLFRRAAYDAVGGHAAVRRKVAEDLALAQRTFAMGFRYHLTMALDQLSTRMYASLGELVRGWRKNIYAGALDATPGGALGRALLPFMLLAFPLFMLLPPLALAVAAVWSALAQAGIIASAAAALPLALWSAVSGAALLVWWMGVYAAARTPLRYAAAYPLASAIILYIVVIALASGRNVEWKGRAYRAG